MVDSCCWVSLHPEELLNAKMSHTAKTRPIADLLPAHYCPAEEEAGLWIAALGGSFWLLQICLQACNSGLSIVAHFSVPILVDVLAAVELLLSAKLAIRYTEQCTRLPAQVLGKQWLTNYIFIFTNLLVLLGKKNRFYGVDMDSDPGHHF